MCVCMRESVCVCGLSPGPTSWDEMDGVKGRKARLVRYGLEDTTEYGLPSNTTCTPYIQYNTIQYGGARQAYGQNIDSSPYGQHELRQDAGLASRPSFSPRGCVADRPCLDCNKVVQCSPHPHSDSNSDFTPHPPPLGLAVFSV